MQAASDSGLIKQIASLLTQAGADTSVLLRILDLVLARFSCVVGTIHTLDAKSGMLLLSVQRGVPEVLMETVRRIPVGKGMAGVAAERKEPVQVCNLQTDTSGVVKPGAKKTQMEGSAAVPMLLEGGILRGVLGVAKPVAYDFTPAELDLLLQIGSVIAQHSGSSTRSDIVDLYFVDARSKLIDIAAFLDRVDRAEGEDDFRMRAFREALKAMAGGTAERAKQVLLAFSDPTTEPLAAAHGKSACGAWPGEQ